MTNNEALMHTWCRMWNEDPGLAHELMTDSCVQFSGQTPGLDTVIGPRQQEEFITRYRAEHINVFVPKVIVDSPDRFGYLWDVTSPDGTVRTGADLNIKNGDKVAENWTFVGQRRGQHPDPVAAHPADRAVIEHLCQRWIGAWNGAATDGLMTDDFELFAGTEAESVDDLRGTPAWSMHLDRRGTRPARSTCSPSGTAGSPGPGA